MSKKIFSLALVLVIAGSLVAANICYAGELFQLAPPPTTDNPKAPSKIALVYNLPKGDWTQIMAQVINLVLGISGSLAFAAFTYGGVMMVTAQGNDEQIRKGKNILYWSLLALAIIAASYGIVVGITQLQFFQ